MKRVQDWGHVEEDDGEVDHSWRERSRSMTPAGLIFFLDGWGVSYCFTTFDTSRPDSSVTWKGQPERSVRHTEQETRTDCRFISVSVEIVRRKRGEWKWLRKTPDVAKRFGHLRSCLKKMLVNVTFCLKWRRCHYVLRSQLWQTCWNWEDRPESNGGCAFIAAEHHLRKSSSAFCMRGMETCHGNF